jgi:hypothetical protein
VRCKLRHMRTVMPSSGSNPIIRATSNQPSIVGRGRNGLRRSIRNSAESRAQHSTAQHSTAQHSTACSTAQHAAPKCLGR